MKIKMKITAMLAISSLVFCLACNPRTNLQQILSKKVSTNNSDSKSSTISTEEAIDLLTRKIKADGLLPSDKLLDVSFADQELCIRVELDQVNAANPNYLLREARIDSISKVVLGQPEITPLWEIFTIDILNNKKYATEKRIIKLYASKSPSRAFKAVAAPDTEPKETFKTTHHMIEYTWKDVTVPYYHTMEVDIKEDYTVFSRLDYAEGCIVNLKKPTEVDSTSSNYTSGRPYMDLYMAAVNKREDEVNVIDRCVEQLDGKEATKITYTSKIQGTKVFSEDYSFVCNGYLYVISFKVFPGNSALLGLVHSIRDSVKIPENSL